MKDENIREQVAERLIKNGKAYDEIEIPTDDGKTKKVLKEINPAHYDRIAMNESFLSVEIYNQLKEDMFFVSMIEEDKGFPHYKIAIKGESFGYLPHQNYTGFTKSGADLKMIKNFGRNKFIGNKKPSRMELGE